MPMTMTPQQPPEPRLPCAAKVLAWSSLLNDIATEMVFPLLPAFVERVLGGSKLHVGMMEGMAEMTASLLKLGAGGWSDRIGKRRVFILGGYTIAALVRPFIGLATLPWHVVAARTADRVGKGLRSAPRDALLTEVTPVAQRGRVFGLNRAMDHLGACLGPLLGLFLLHYVVGGDLQLLFLLTAVPGIVVVALVYFLLPESTPTPPRIENVSRWSLRPYGRPYQIYLLALALFTLANSSDAFINSRALDLGFNLDAILLLWAGIHALKSGLSYLAGGWVDRFGARRFILLGWVLYSFFYLGFASVDEPGQLIVLALLYASTFAFIEPAERKYVGDLVGAERKGLAFGWFHFVVGILTLPANVGFGWLYKNWSATWAFGAGAVLALLAAVVLLLIPTARGAQRGTG